MYCTGCSHKQVVVLNNNEHHPFSASDQRVDKFEYVDEMEEFIGSLRSMESLNEC